MAGMYGYSSGLGKVPGNWAGHSTVPDHMINNDLGDLDTRPTHMRGGFFPDHLAIPRALGEVDDSNNTFPFTMMGDEIKQKSFLDKLGEKPYLLMAVGIGLGGLIAYAIIGPKNFMRRRKRRRRRR